MTPSQGWFAGLNLTSGAFAEPAAAEIRVDSIVTYDPPETLAARGQYLRRNPHVKEIYHAPAGVFWAFYDLSPRHVAPSWHVLGPCKPTDDEPFDPGAAGGRLTPEVLNAPVPRSAGPALTWKSVAPDAKGMVDYGAVAGRDETTVAWLQAVIRSDESGEAILFVAGSPAYWAWLNGVPILSKPERSSYARRQAVRVMLRAGENPLAVRAALHAAGENAPLGFHLHRLRPGEAPPAGTDPPAAPRRSRKARYNVGGRAASCQCGTTFVRRPRRTARGKHSTGCGRP